MSNISKPLKKALPKSKKKAFTQKQKERLYPKAKRKPLPKSKKKGFTQKQKESLTKLSIR